MNLATKKKWAVAACVVVLLFYPFEWTVVPEWKIRVVDQARKPVANMVVTERWRHHSLEFQGHLENRTTDSDGYVIFPHRAIRASLVFRAVGWGVAHLNVHGRSGPEASTTVDGDYGDSDYSPGKPLRKVIVVRRQP